MNSLIHPPLPSNKVVARDCVQDEGEKFKESAMFYATARQRNAEKEMSEATLRKMHRKALAPSSFLFSQFFYA